MLARSKLGQHSSRWPAFPAVQEAATPSEPQRVRLLLPGLILHRSSPEETPPEPFCSAGPLAYAFHFLNSLSSMAPGGLDSFLRELRHLVSLWEDGRARLGWEEEATFYEHTAVANSWREIARLELNRKRVTGI